MLHAFNAVSGAEEFAYVPSPVVPNLAQIAQPSFEGRYYVDGPLVAEDAYFGGAWHTVLVGGLGAGGKGLFALDVTSPSVLDEDELATRLLWEFTDDTSDRLGYTYSRPSIVRMNNGNWAVVTGNGYMSEKGKAVLMIIDIATGALIRKIEVDDDDGNGLSSPALIDIDGDYKVDYAYAGDLNGNLWKFDLTSSNPDDWDTAWDKSPLFKTRYDVNLGQRQPITTAPTVGHHPESGYFVYIATGQILDDADMMGDKAVSPQSVYGIWDNNPASGAVPISLSQLIKQKIQIASHPDDSETVRTATNKKPDWSVHLGWETRLDASGFVPGTRVVTDHVLRDGRIQFTSTDPTVGSGESYLMQLNANTGGAPSQIVIDVNGDGSLDVSDNVDGNSDGSVTNWPVDRVVGQYLGFGIASMPMVASIGGDDAAIVNQIYTGTPGDSPGGGPPPEEEDDSDPGLAGGHIDVDTSTRIYDYDDGATNKHVHEWDDKFNQTVVDFFDMRETDFDYIDEAGQPPKKGNKEFIITVANATLSPGAVIEINGVGVPATEYRAKVKRYLAGNLGVAEKFPKYVLGSPSPAQAAAGVVQLKSFKLAFAKDVISKGGVHPTETGCVKDNEPGQNREYRNGALTIQALDATGHNDTYVYDDSLSAYISSAKSHAIHDLGHAASQDGEDDGTMFWETSVFWHWKGGCFGLNEKESYDKNFEEQIGKADDRETDDDIPSDPPPPPPEDEGEPGDGTGIDTGTPASFTVTTTRIRGQRFGRLSWRELMIDE
jgi:hypothetical protein